MDLSGHSKKRFIEPLFQYFLILLGTLEVERDIDLMLTVPQTYPMDKISVSLRNNFNENLVVKHCQEDQFEKVKIIKQYKSMRKI